MTDPIKLAEEIEDLVHGASSSDSESTRDEINSASGVIVVLRGKLLAAALRLAEALDERDRTVAKNPIAAITECAEWVNRFAALLAAYCTAKAAVK